MIFPSRMSFKTKAITCVQWFALLSINIVGLTFIIVLVKMALNLIFS